MPRSPTLLQQQLDPAEILDPQRDRRMLEDAFGVTAVLALLAPCFLTRRDILGRQQHLRKRLLVAGQAPQPRSWISSRRPDSV